MKGTHPEYNGVKKFAVNAGLLLVLLFGIDKAAGLFLRHLYFNQQTGPEQRIRHAMEETTADIIIIGTSKGVRNYHPGILEDKFKMQYFNAANEGCMMLYHDGIVRGILKRHTPKLVLLDFRYGEFRTDKKIYQSIEKLNPFYKTHPEIRPLIELGGRYERIKMYSGIYPFNSLLYQLLARSKSSYQEAVKVEKGYKYYSSVWNGAKDNSDKFNAAYLLDSNTVNAYTSIVRNCKKAGTRLVVVVSPYFRVLNEKDTSVELAKKIAADNGVDFIDFSHDRHYAENNGQFADPLHLNEHGASLFSARLADSILLRK